MSWPAHSVLRRRKRSSAYILFSFSPFTSSYRSPTISFNVMACAFSSSEAEAFFRLYPFFLFPFYQFVQVSHYLFQCHGLRIQFFGGGSVLPPAHSVLRRRKRSLYPFFLFPFYQFVQVSHYLFQCHGLRIQFFGGGSALPPISFFPFPLLPVRTDPPLSLSMSWPAHSVLRRRKRSSAYILFSFSPFTSSYRSPTISFNVMACAFSSSEAEALSSAVAAFCCVACSIWETAVLICVIP